MKVCILGAGGLIGRNLYQHLKDNGHQLVGVTQHSPCPLEFATSTWYSSNNVPIAKVLTDGAPWDLIVDLRAYEPNDLRGIVELASIVTNHWIHISTIYVYRRLRESLERKNRERFLPVPISESSECHPSGSYGIGKFRCEQIWLDAYNKHGTPITIVRLPFVYGPYDRSQRVIYYIKRLLEGLPIYLPSSGRHKIDLLYAGDLANILAKLACRQESYGNIYNITSYPAIPLYIHIERLAEILGMPALIEPLEETSDYAQYPPYAYPVDIVLDHSKLLSVLGELPNSSLLETWQITVPWECSQAEITI